ncbi:hypothetical protein N9S53_00600 [Candidatus Pelagibacter sp.]|nr:hypothetical protein [Candidatus Pelagibacter sp.]
MKIFNSDTRSVILNYGKAYKFFNSRSECEEEVKRLKKSPISEVYDEISNYKMKIVKILEVKEYFYSMDQAKGEILGVNHNYKDFYLAGRWLKCFHDLSIKNDSKVFLFGDFVVSHLYLDHKNKIISTIDPGTNFGNSGEIETDISRFIVSLLYTKNFNLRKLSKVINSFFEGYGIQKINFTKLDNFIKYRILRNFNKTNKLKTELKYHIIALIYLNIANFKYFFIKKKLKIF